MELQRIKNWISNFVHLSINKQITEERFKVLESQNAELKRMLEDTISNIVSIICENREALSDLNRELSITPTVWGDRKRLHISEKASVSSAFFNLNSGDITIGDDSFTGSNVSLLTGSHDMKLKGLLRRDCEIKEGNDIIIGNGVWIASNATILGPCVIKDNAVVAAGAVVLPKTVIEENEVYGGIPANKISQIDSEADWSIGNESIKAALARENGILFAYGWTEKKHLTVEGEGHTGHYLSAEEAAIITDRDELEIFYKLDGDEQSAWIELGRKKINLNGNSGHITIQPTDRISYIRSSSRNLFLSR